MYWHDGWMAGGWLAMLLFWAVVIALLVGAARYLFSGDRGEYRTEPSARELLDRAYARGEISQIEYQRKRDDLDRPRA